jgi:hypothetical protein
MMTSPTQNTLVCRRMSQGKPPPSHMHKLVMACVVSSSNHTASHFGRDFLFQLRCSQSTSTGNRKSLLPKTQRVHHFLPNVKIDNHCVDYSLARWHSFISAILQLNFPTENNKVTRPNFIGLSSAQRPSYPKAWAFSTTQYAGNRRKSGSYTMSLHGSPFLFARLREKDGGESGQRFR